MKKSTRYYPLVEEIRLHVLSWAMDEEWEILPKGLQNAILLAVNEVKTYETVKAVGSTEQKEKSISDKKKHFIAVFKQKYIENVGIDFIEPITALNQVNIKRVIQTIEENGGTFVEFLEWFYDDFCSLEFNKKKFFPPQINSICNAAIVSKFLYDKKDQLAQRKNYLGNAALKTAILKIAIPLTERTQNKDLSQKLLELSEDKIPLMKFFEILKNFANNLSDEEAKRQCAELEGKCSKEK